MDLKALEKMLERDSDNPMLHYTIGALFLKEGSPEQAVDHLQKAVALNPTHSASWKLYGKVLTKLDRLEQAAKAYKKAMSALDVGTDETTGSTVGARTRHLL